MGEIEKMHLKRQLCLAPIKLILSIVLGIVAFKQYGIEIATIIALTTYGGLSTIFFFAKFWRNKIIGFIIGVVIFTCIIVGVQALNKNKQLPQWAIMAILLFLTFAGILFDISRVIKLVQINRKEKEFLNNHSG